jgi:hypothetical protein
MPSVCRLIAAVLIVLASASCATAPTGPEPPLTAPRHEIVLDGKLDDWTGVPFVEVTPKTGVFDDESSRTRSTKDLSYRFAVCHDGEAMYVAVEVTDDRRQVDTTEPGETSARAWNDDAVEVFIDGNHNRARNARDPEREEYSFGGEFSLVNNGAATSHCTAWPGSFGKADHWQGAVSHDELPERAGVLLRYEYRLTWRVMGGQVGPGDTIGFTIAVQDDDDGGDRDHSLYWKGISPHCWQNEAGWGEVTLAPQAIRTEGGDVEQR